MFIKIKWIAMSFVLVGFFTGLSPSIAHAADDSNSLTVGGTGDGLDTPAEASSNRKTLYRSVNIRGSLGLVEHPGGFYNIATARLKCRQRNCRIDANMFVQFRSGADDNQYAICLAVDNTTVTCPFLGSFNSSLVIHGITTIKSGIGYSKGWHDVTLRMYSGALVTIGNYDATFNSYYRGN